MVEVWGVEPQSESQTTESSPSAVHVLTFPPPNRHGRRYGFSSFIKSRRSQSFDRLVPCFCSADDLRRRRLRADVRGLRPRKLRYRSCQLILISRCWAVQGRRSLILPSIPPSKPVHPHDFSRGPRTCAQCRAARPAWPCRRAYRRASCPGTARPAPSRGRSSDKFPAE